MSEDLTPINPDPADHPDTPPQVAEPDERPQDAHPQSVLVKRILQVGLILASLSALFYAAIYVQTGAWQLLAYVGSLAATDIILLVAYRHQRRGNLDAAGTLALIAVATTAYGTPELLWSGATAYIVSGGVLLLLLVGIGTKPGQVRTWLVAIGLYLAYTLLAGQLRLFPRYDVAQSPLLQAYIPAITATVALAILWQVGRAFRLGSLRTRLIITFIALVLLSAVVISLTTAVLGLRGGRRQVIGQLESVAALKEAEITTWVESLQVNLALALREETTARDAWRLLQFRLSGTSLLEARTNILRDFNYTLEQSQLFEEMFLMNLDGKVILSTDPDQEEKSFSLYGFFQEGLKGPYVQPLAYSNAQARVVALVSRPVRNPDGEVVGVQAGRASIQNLDALMSERAGLGETGETYLVSADYALLTASPFESYEPGQTYVRSQAAAAALEEHTNGSGLYRDYRGEPVIGVYRWLPSLSAALIAEQDQAEAFQAINVTTFTNAAISLGAVSVAVALALVASQSIAGPLSELADFSKRVAAGELGQLIPVRRQDEVGELAEAFNQMTVQLRQTLAGLEQRIAERTKDLERRARYLEAAAEVGRSATEIHDLDDLLTSVTHLISERFGFYHVGVFLLDDPREYAVLRAANSEGGWRMLARGHRLQVGVQGIVGFVAGSGKPRIEQQVGEDEVYYPNPDLPRTRSEMALPLVAGGELVGALDVQSDEAQAFSEEDVAVLQVLADEVAIAIHNARLFEQLQERVEAERRLYGELTEEAWARLIRAQSALGFRSTEQGVARIEDIESPGDGHAEKTAEDPKKIPISIPIKVRGDTVIGYLDTYKPSSSGSWNEDEIAFLENISQQLATALENARLFEETQRLARREQIASQVASRVWASTEVENILQTAVRELGRALNAAEGTIRLEITEGEQ